MTSKLNPNYKLTTHTYSSVTCSPWMLCSCTSWSCRRNVRTFRNWMRESSQRLKDGSRNSQSHWQISLWDYCEIGLRQEIWRHISSRVLLGLEDHCKSCEGYSTIFARHSQRNQVIFVCLKQGTPNPHGLENPFPYGHDHGHDLPHFQPGSGGMPCSHVSLRPRSWYLPLGPGREQKFRVWYVWSPVSNSFNNLSWLMLTGCTVSQQSPAWESAESPFTNFWDGISRFLMQNNMNNTLWVWLAPRTCMISWMCCTYVKLHVDTLCVRRSNYLTTAYFVWRHQSWRCLARRLTSKVDKSLSQAGKNLRRFYGIPESHVPSKSWAGWPSTIVGPKTSPRKNACGYLSRASA